MVENKIIDENIVKQIMQKHNLVKTIKIEKSETGTVNPCFFINNEYVLRVNTRDKNVKKFLCEKTLYDYLERRKFPSPKVIVYDDSSQIIPYEYIITKKENGISLQEYMKNINSSKKKKLIISAGKLLGELHKFKFEKYGDIDNRLGNFNSWSEYLLDKVNGELKTCKRLNIFENDIIEKIRGIFLSSKTLFDKIKDASIVHYDFNFSNLLCNNEDITLVYDFEFSRLGDKEMDFAVLEIEEFDDKPKIREWFYQGYELTNKFRDDFESISNLYKLFYLLEIIIPITLHRPENVQNWVKSEIMNVIGNI